MNQLKKNQKANLNHNQKVENLNQTRKKVNLFQRARENLHLKENQIQNLNLNQLLNQLLVKNTMNLKKQLED